MMVILFTTAILWSYCTYYGYTYYGEPRAGVALLRLRPRLPAVRRLTLPLTLTLTLTLTLMLTLT